MVTLAVVTVLGLIAAPALQVYLPRYRVDNASKALMSELQLARLRAVSKNLPHTLTFDDGDQSIVMESVDAGGTATVVNTILFDKDGRDGATFPGVTLGRLASASAPPDSATGDTSASAAFGTPGSASVSSVITFLPNGLSDMSGEFYITPTADYVNSNGDNTRAVQVLRAGMVRRFKLASGAWEAQ